MAARRILVVAVDPVVTEPIRTALEREGHTVQLAGSGPGALSALAEGAWDLAAVSLTLPDDDGLELVTALRGRRPEVPVVVITPAARRAQGLAARERGAYAFLETPHDLSREKVLMVVRNALEHRDLAAALAAARPAGGVSLNLDERERQAIVEALEATRWNKQAAARLLGLHRPTLYAKLRKHGLPQRPAP